MNSLWPTISVLLLQRVLQQEQPPTPRGRVGNFKPALSGEFHTGACASSADRSQEAFG